MSETDNAAQNNGNERTVTDPVTHQPIRIHDISNLELEQIPPPPTDKNENERKRNDDGSSSASRHKKMDALVHELTSENWWEDPLGDQGRTRIQTAIVAAAAAGVCGFGGLFMYWSFNRSLGRQGPWGFIDALAVPIGCIMLALCVGATAIGFRLIQDEPKTTPHFPEHERKDIRRLLQHDGNQDGPETVAWLNSFLECLWPIINPALFVSVSDILEDSLQATLPKFIYGVRVADLGQGSEPVRVLGIKWLDAGAAAKEVDGMQAEEGDFINMEVSLAYRARSTTSKGLRSRSANVHILMEFWIAGGIVLPVWVELTGLLATARLRIQLTPNPPFLSLMTLTLLGKPKVTLKCTPLAKNFLNVMDIPGLSNWIQSSIDATATEYVAPRSINLDLKSMLAGRPKMDTDAAGVVIVTIRKAWGFGLDKPKTFLKNPLNKGSDLYVTVGWSKWGKPLWSTRIIQKEGTPVWEETTALLVGQTELNAQEGLKLQVWDSDRFTADDLHGNIDIPLTDILSNPSTHNSLSTRQDSLKDSRGEPAKGTLLWEVGYFEKTTLAQHLEKKHQNYEQVRDEIEQAAERKLREAVAAGDEKRGEVEQQKEEDLKERSDEIISGSAPTTDWPSGILSIRIEQISGLEVEKIRESGVKDEAEEDDSDELPSGYCTVIVNHQRVYKTRTKMKSNNPYFDAGTEKFIRNWRNTTVMIAVRDNRLHENDPLLGIVVLPLCDVLKHRSQWIGSLPIVGGIGYGRMRLSLTFRSIQIHLPRRLLGWDVGTLEIYSPVQSTIQVPTEFATCNLVFRTTHAKGKMKPQHEGGWGERHGHPIRLAVKKRYASCLVLQLRKAAVGPDVTPAFCKLWLKDLPDDEEVSVSLPICKNDKEMLAHAKSNATTAVDGDLGRIELRLKFWSGLSGYHHTIADKDHNMADVMEVLDCEEGSDHLKQNDFPEEEGYESSDLDSSSTLTMEEEEKSEAEAESSAAAADFKVARKRTGPFKDFRQKNRELHRKHRGLMQWRAARSVAWVGRGVEDTASKIGGRVTSQFKHRDRDAGIEKEA